MAPPANTYVTKELYSRLNHNLWNERTQNFQKRTRFQKGSTIVVQKVKPAPKIKLLIGCAPPKLRVLNKEINKFILRVEDKESFGLRFNATFTKVRKLLRHAPCLILHFQVFIDIRGNIYHLDIDQCFNAKLQRKRMSN